MSGGQTAQIHDASPKSERARARILSAAEEVFADAGYEGASLRMIAARAKVPVALISYHFGPKPELYRALFEARAPQIVEQRRIGLDMARLEPNLDRRLELIVRALFVPMMGLRGTGTFGRLLARETTDPASAERQIFTIMFDPVARRFIAELQECLPDWQPRDVHYAYHSLLGVMSFFLSDAGRIARLSEDAANPDRIEEVTKFAVDLMVAGLRHHPRR